MNIYQNVHKQPHYFFGSPSKFMILNDSYSKYCFTWKVFIFLLRNFDECEEVETDETTSDMHVSVQSPQSIAKSAKVICSLDLLLQMFQGKCRHPACNDKVSTKYTLIGTSVLINWTCSSGHCGKFYSSYDCNGVLATNLQTAASILLSGNNFTKI